MNIGASPHRHALRIFAYMFLATAVLLPSSAQSQDITSNLVGHWTLDETSGATITDSGSGGNAGTWSDGVDNDVATDQATGQVNTALDFDGIDNQISLGDPASLQLTGDMTISAWVNADRTGGESGEPEQVIVNKRGLSPSRSYSLILSDADDMAHFIVASSSTTIVVRRSSTTINTGEWYHIAGVYDATAQTMNVYINGTLDNGTLSGTIPAAQYSNNGQPVLIGGRNDASAQNFDGRIDDARIYDRTLSAADITALHANTTPSAATNELVGHWTLDETSGSTITDSGTGGNDGTWIDGADTDVTGETIAGQIGTALDFDGTNDNILIGNPVDGSLDFNASQNFSYSQWIKSSDINSFSFSKKILSNGYEILIGRGGVAGTYNCRIGDGITDVYSADFTGNNDGAWHLVTCVIDRSTNEVRIYGDGVLIGPSTDITGFGSVETDTTLRLGARGASNSYGDCDIDDTRVYNYAISPAEVTALYAAAGNITTGLVGHWTMDEGSGSTAADSISTNDATLNGMEAADWVTGALGQGVKFDDSSEYLDTGDTDIIGGATEASVCTWLYYTPASVTTDGAIISKYSGGGWMMFVDDVAWNSGRQNTISFTPWDGAMQIEGSANLVTPGQWDHYCVTFNGGNFVRLYKNGVLDTEETAGIPATIHDNDSDLTMGRTSSGSRALNAQLDDVRIYNTALSATDIAALYIYTPPADTSTGLIGHWKLDETSGTTAVDSSGSGLDGTINGTDGATATTAGNDGTALDFDGSDDQIIIPDDAALDFGANDFSVSYWVNKQAMITLWDNYAGVGKWNSGSSPGTNEWGLGLGWTSATNTPSFYIESGATTYGAVSPDDLTTSQWYHLLGVREGTDIKLYVDGALKATTPIGNVAVNNIGEDFNIGRIVANYTDAIFDDVRIYNRALNATDAAALYSGLAPLASNCSNPVAPPGTMIYNYDYNALQYCNGFGWMAIGPSTDLASGLVGHWELNETSGSSIADSSTNSNTGTWVDGDDTDVTGETTAGKVGTGLTFDAADDYINAGSDISLDDIWTGGGAISAWIYPITEGEGTYGRIVAKGNSSTWQWHLHMDGNRGRAIAFAIGCGGGNIWWRTNTDSVPLNQWSHVTVTYNSDDSSNNTPTIYINGIPVPYTTAGSCTNPIDSDASRDFTIGNEINQGRTFDGNIDDVRVYDRMLSTAEVNGLHAMGTSCPEPDTANLAGHWTMDETSGTTSADSSANANDLTMYNGLDAGTDSTAGQVGAALQFDATNDYAQSNASIDLSGTDAVTISAWVNRTYSNAGSNTLFEFSTNTNSFNDGFGFFPDDRGSTCGAGGGIMMMHRGNIGYNAKCFTQPSSGVWHHLVAIYDKGQDFSNELTFYIDGVKQVTTNHNYVQDNTNNFGNHPLFLSTRGGTIEFNANTMDDFRIYDRALTPIEITSLYGSTSTCTLSACSDPVGIEREIVFNTSSNVMQYCNGGSWIAMGPPSDGGSPCTSPAALAGELRYNSTLNVLQYCEGNEWMAVTGHVQ